MSPSYQPTPKAPRLRCWKHGTIPVIGLTGGIGSGKSRVASLLANRGAVVIDADRVGHEVLQEPEVRRQVVSRFGPGVEQRSAAGIPGENPIDRRALGAIVFADPAALRDLEALLHPRMERRFHDDILRTAKAGTASAIVLDAAILLERGWDRYCDLIVYVEAPSPLRLDRVAATRGWDAETLQAREAAQWPLAIKRGRADLVLVNDTDLPSLERAVAGLLESLPRFRVRPVDETVPRGERISPLPVPTASEQAP